MVATDGQSWRRLKRIAIVFFWNLVRLRVLQSSFSLQWNGQHVTSVGQRKYLSPRQDLNLWPPKHRACALSTLSYGELMERCLGGHRFKSCRGLRFFFVPRSWHADHFTVTFVSPCLKFTIFHSFIFVVSNVCYNAWETFVGHDALILWFISNFSSSIANQDA